MTQTPFSKLRPLLALLLILTFLPTTPAQQTSLPPTISVRGKATLAAPPDTATITTGITTTAPTAQQALTSNNAAFRALLRLLSLQNIPPADIQTSFFSVSPRFARRAPDGSPGPITGYQVTNDVRVTIRAVDNLGAVLDALARAASASISGVAFSIRDDAALVNRALALAVKDGMGRAQVLAAAAGVKLGALIAVSELPISAPSAPSLSLAESSVPVAPGVLDVAATVFLQFAIV